jgi:hypothetical protein
MEFDKVRKGMIIGLGILVMCSLAATARTQTKSKPDLSGTWELDKTRSEKTNIPLEDSETSVVIVQHDPEIRMVRKFGLGSGNEFALQVVYYVDQRGETYQDPYSYLTTLRYISYVARTQSIPLPSEVTCPGYG